MGNDTLSEIEKEVQLSNEAFSTFVDRMVTFSTGALTLSIAFRNSLTGHVPKCLWLLKAAWIGFVVVIICGTFWYKAMFKVHRDMARELGRPTSENSLAFATPNNTYNALWKVMTWTFPLSIGALVLFALLNL